MPALARLKYGLPKYGNRRLGCTHCKPPDAEDSPPIPVVLRFSFFAPGERMYPEPSVFVYIVCVGSTAASIRRRESALLDKQLPDGIQHKKSGLLQSVDSLQGNIHRDILAVSSVKVAVSGSYRP